MKFYEHIVALRRSGKIPVQWTIADIEPFLRMYFQPNTINIYPQNCSISPDGSEMGDYVKRLRQKPKFYRLGQATFELIEECGNPPVPYSPKAKGQCDLKRKYASNEDLQAVFNTREVFFEYVKICNDHFRLNSQSLFLYQEIISRRRKNNLSELISECGVGSFLELTYRTLIEWGMDSRAAKLMDFQTFKDSVSNYTRELEELSSYRICDLDPNGVDDLLNKVVVLFTGMKVMSSKCRIVGVSKTLHFLLPDLIIPIDRNYTLRFYYGKPEVTFSTIKKEINVFKRIFADAFHLVRQLSLSQADVDGQGWNQSIPKLVDNAIIGYKKSH
jgi:hypothetical protein